MHTLVVEFISNQLDSIFKTLVCSKINELYFYFIFYRIAHMSYLFANIVKNFFISSAIGNKLNKKIAMGIAFRLKKFFDREILLIYFIH